MQASSESMIKTYPNLAQSFVITGILIALMLVVSPINFVLTDIIGREPTMFLYYVLATGISFWIINTIRRNITSDGSFVFTVHNPRIIPVIIVIAIVLIFGIISPLASLIPMPESFKVAFKSLAELTGVLSFAMMVIAAPVLEELIFRGIMLEGLLKKYTPMRSIMISSLLFGFVHLNPWQFIAGFILGVFSGWIYYKTRSLMPSIIIHAGANLSGYLARFFVDPDSLDDTIFEMYGGVTNLIAVVLGSVIIVWIGVYFLQKEFARRPLRTPASQLPE
jgi:membrane protease YdiL (CAAX protease family)